MIKAMPTKIKHFWKFVKHLGCGKY